jgi:DNA-binding NtrC family response regulator
MTPCTNRDFTQRDALISQPLIFVVEDDWRTRRFICTVLKYATNAHVMEASCAHTALSMAQALDRPIDLLISEVDLAGAECGLDLPRKMAARSPSMNVLLVSFRDCPPGNTPPAWRFLSIPFPTATFLSCVNQLCGSSKRAFKWRIADCSPIPSAERRAPAES